MLSEAHVECLLMAVLAVGQYPLERVRSILGGLRAQGLANASKVAAMDLGELTVALSRAGYNRGLLTSVYGERVHAVMKAIVAGELDVVLDYVTSNDRSSFVAKLQELYGIGPKVASNAWDLLRAMRGV